MDASCAGESGLVSVFRTCALLHNFTGGAVFVSPLLRPTSTLPPTAACRGDTQNSPHITCIIVGDVVAWLYPQGPKSSSPPQAFFFVAEKYRP